MVFIGGMLWFDVGLQFNALLTKLKKKKKSLTAEWKTEMCFPAAANS